MKNLFRVLCGVSVMSMIPAVAGAVGTYYNGNLYQNPQQRYSRGGYYNSYGYGSERNYGQQRAYGNQYGVERQLGTQKQQGQNKKATQQTSVKQGFVLDAGISHEIGKWEFDMNKAGSHLHYDNLAWNVLDARGTYYFGDSTKMQVTAGFKYGMQYGETSMIDDDISSDKAIKLETRKEYNYNGTEVVSGQFLVGNPAMSVGGSKNGTQMGFNVAFGLTDFFTWGKMKVTPSIGYRYFKHKLTTKNNKGMAVGVFSGIAGTSSEPILNCVRPDENSDEVQCAPVLVFGNGPFYDGAGNYYVGYDGDYYYSTVDPTKLYDGDGDNAVYLGTIYPILNNTAADWIDTPGTYYYEQPGTSHEYETEWAGPYLALDMEYQINNDNLVTAGVEFGLPKYDSKGNQPYRWDWKHPTSVEDEGDFGDAYHLGLNANWETAISDSMFLSLGFTYDYYKVSDATANTYLNGTYYQKMLDAVNNTLENAPENADVTYYEDLRTELNSYRSKGWKVEDKKEINSVYKSMGIRIGINVKF